MGFAILVCFLGLLWFVFGMAFVHYGLKAGHYWENKKSRGFLYDYEKEDYKEQVSWCIVNLVGYILCTILIILPMM